ncbi:hypothetical protein ACFVWR_01240 [Leifsonia sp. NPDC058292]|uniref:hypothetical protein n=1 Tax=Leifsonia sp. NPDC058292 TaxID=3346428 RepID=UPI0036DE4F30
MRKTLKSAAMVVAIGVVAAVAQGLPANGATSCATLAPSDPSPGQRLGYSIAQSSDGEVTVAGSTQRYNGTTYDPSVAYVYVGATGSDLTATETAQLVRTDPVGMSGNDSFGSSVDVSGNGDTIVVGAQNYASGIGAVYVFQRTSSTSWEQSAHLDAPAGASSGQFGTSVAISDDGTRLLAGAPALSTSSQGGTAYYVLENGSWVLKTVVPGGSASALGGQDVEISADGTRAAVGAPQYKTTAGVYSGRVYTYTVTSSGLTPLATITDPSTAASSSTGSSFGFGALSFTADDNGLLIGAPFATAAPGTTGSSLGGIAFYYRYAGGWSRSATFSFPGTTSARLGYAGGISPDGTRIVVGAPYYTGTPGGRAFYSQKTGTAWGALGFVGPTGNNSSARVGISAGFGSNSRFVIGANTQDNPAGIRSGLAYVVDAS